MTISTARKIAFDVLLRVATQDAYADEALRGLLIKTVGVEDAGLATELSFGTLRWQRLLDFLVDRHLTTSSKVLDVEVRLALRLGVYQLYFLTRVPARAAVHESVELVKLARKRSAAPLVNAVLRKIAKESAQRKSPVDTVTPLLPIGASIANQLGILYSHPSWLVERWLIRFGEDRTRTLLAANNHVPALSGYILNPDRDPQRNEKTLASLEKAGCKVTPGLLVRDSYTLEGGNPAASEAARRGWLAIQDEASQAVARLVGVEPGNSVLDLCAAPGGKTLRLAVDAGASGHVVAADLHAHRVRSMAERFEHAGIRNIETLTLDATGRIPFERRFDRILVDVPCSGTGTLARHPEIRWRLGPPDLQDLHARQTSLLKNALPLLASDGHLIYSTCSLEPEENENVVDEALGALGSAYVRVSIREKAQGLFRESVPVESVICPDGFFRTSPSKHKTDGFFAAMIQRKK